ncbi:hypothetical protein SmJEL517_g04555 [Synchytrium microbalum]|uniref:SH3 domain-containing protein n=1 Tax=Synchytrium microbalum TaxID=1806994 RepID=A0A507C401_9FUNG|nr:uncharacterized protein SmJEL517_g04555 [Synchytrium microbalum]TPX32295.1 hypothetical protein SmJEL517_g04555 [Synchytrium microbalum]
MDLKSRFSSVFRRQRPNNQPQDPLFVTNVPVGLEDPNIERVSYGAANNENNGSGNSSQTAVSPDLSALSTFNEQDQLKPEPARTDMVHPPSYSASSPVLTQYRVVLAYTPLEPDELALNLGDLVVVTESFVDGWSHGYSQSSGRSGMVPMAALEEIREIQHLTDPQLKDLASMHSNTQIARTESNIRNDELSDLKTWLNPPDFRLTMFTLKEKRLKSTRGWLLDELNEWIVGNGQSSVYWLSGVAGVGKSVIAGCFADALENRNQLAAHFFCKHDELARNDPFRVISTWAFQLAAFDADVRRTLRDLRESEPNFFVNTPSIGLQFEQLIVRPLSSYRGGKAVMLLDALDECAEEGSTLRKDFLEALGRHFARLPNNIVLFITSRPLQDLRKQLSNYKPRMMTLEAADNLNDIKLYAFYRLKHLRSILDSDEIVDTLADKLSVMAHGLFVWLYLACDAMDTSDDPTQTIVELEQRSLGNDEDRMDTLYTRALVASFKGALESAKQLCNRLLGVLVALRTPMSVEDISSLVRMPSTTIKINLTRVESVLVISKSSVQLMHKSVADFITSSDRCIGDALPFYINRQLAEAHLARVCLVCLPADLDLKIIQVQIERLRGIAPSDTPTYIRYSLNHWGDHLNSVEQMDSELTEILTQTLRSYGRAMLIVAVLKNLPVALKHILRVGGGPNLLKAAEELNFFKSPILLEAAISGNAEVGDALLEYGGADVDCRSNDFFWQTPLFVSSFTNKTVDMVKVVLRHNADIDLVTGIGLKSDAVCSGLPLRLILQERIRRKRKRDESRMNDAMNSARLADVNRLKELLNANPSMNINQQYPDCSNKNLLLVACQYGSVDVAIYLLGIGADPNITDDQSRSPLHHACAYGSLTTVKALMEAGAKIDAEGEDSKGPYFQNAFVRPIDLACEKGHIEIVRWMLDTGVSPSAIGHDKIHPLLYAAMGGSVEVAQLLIAKGANVNYQSKYFGTAIFAAACYGVQNMVVYLIHVGADLQLGWNAPDLELEVCRAPNIPPFTGACWYACAEAAATLLDKDQINGSGFRLEMKRGGVWYRCTSTPLIYAAIWDQSEWTRTLLDNGADIEGTSVRQLVPDLIGGTALVNAVFYGRLNAARTLLAAGANNNVRVANGKTCMHIAAYGPMIGDRGKSDMVRLLRFYKANLDDADPDGNTPLHMAITMKATLVVDTLLELGARIDIVNHLGNSCLHEAVRQRAAGMVKVLTDNSADRNIENKEGMTPLQIAVKEGYNELLHLLK